MYLAGPMAGMLRMRKRRLAGLMAGIPMINKPGSYESQGRLPPWLLCALTFTVMTPLFNDPVSVSAYWIGTEEKAFTNRADASSVFGSRSGLSARRETAAFSGFKYASRSRTDACAEEGVSPKQAQRAEYRKPENRPPPGPASAGFSHSCIFTASPS